LAGLSSAKLLPTNNLLRLARLKAKAPASCWGFLDLYI
jgi:hypothetical protein